MAVYAHLNNFLRSVRAANPTFEKHKTSSLRPLINILNSPTGTANQVLNAVAALPTAKTARYLDALYYLLANYPGLPLNAASRLNMPALAKTNTARYTQTQMPNNFNPQGPQNGRVFVTPQSQFINCTVEQFILNNATTTGILLIHLSSWQNGMDTTFNGRSVVQHITSVLRVGRLKGCPVCVLTMEADSDVCAEMRAEFNQFPAVTRVYEPNHHMGSSHQHFRDFVTARQNLVVMGFDACVCVFANVFGANEKMPDNSYRPPLATLANVVMSRATLVTTGTVNSQSATMGAAEYGPLFNT